jgi:hypothetical protein
MMYSHAIYAYTEVLSARAQICMYKHTHVIIRTNARARHVCAHALQACICIHVCMNIFATTAWSWTLKFNLCTPSVHVFQMFIHTHTHTHTHTNICIHSTKKIALQHTCAYDVSSISMYLWTGMHSNHWRITRTRTHDVTNHTHKNTWWIKTHDSKHTHKRSVSNHFHGITNIYTGVSIYNHANC